jgi:hypothetical protein
LIKITEEKIEQEKKGTGKIEVRLENKEVAIFDSYPIVVDSNEMKYIHYEVQKKQSDPKNQSNEKHGILDKAKQKALEVKDTVVDTTK